MATKEGPDLSSCLHLSSSRATPRSLSILCTPPIFFFLPNIFMENDSGFRGETIVRKTQEITASINPRSGPFSKRVSRSTGFQIYRFTDSEIRSLQTLIFPLSAISPPCLYLIENTRFHRRAYSRGKKKESLHVARGIFARCQLIK